LKGVEDRPAAEELKGCHIWVPEMAVEPVSGDEYFWVDLIGCEVWDVEKGELLGSVTGLQEFGAQDILCVCTPSGVQPSGEWLLPFVDGVILHVNLGNRRIDVRLPDGMEACFTPRS
jgi:16S rRNA processing protein RimM